MKKLIVFDIAGTTLQDSNLVNSTFIEAFSDFGFHVNHDQVSKVMGLSKPKAIQLILDELKVSFNHLEIHDRFLERLKLSYSDEKNVQEIIGATETFRELKKQGYSIALDTGFDKNITQMILDQTGWKYYGAVDAVITSDIVSSGRPYPYMIFHAMEELGIQRVQDVIKVGDTASDIEEGLNAGCGMVIAVTSGTYSRAQLRACPGNFYILPDITHIPNFLKAIKEDK